MYKWFRGKNPKGMVTFIPRKFFTVVYMHERADKRFIPLICYTFHACDKVGRQRGIVTDMRRAPTGTIQCNEINDHYQCRWLYMSPQKKICPNVLT